MNLPAPAALLMTGDDYRESLRAYRPRVYLDGRLVDSVADEPGFAPGINALALTYDYAHKPEYAKLMTAVQHSSGKTVNRLSHINTSAGDLLNKLEAVRLVCQETGCAQRYLTHDALNAIGQVTARLDDARGSTEHTARFLNYLHRVQDQDLSLGVAMTDAKGDRSKRPHQQPEVDSYLHIVDRNALHNGQRGILISGTKAIVTGAPYMHRIAHYVSGGLIVTLPGPDEDHNPETSAKLSEVLRANPDVPYAQRIETARFIEDLTAGYQGGWYSVISLHGGGSPAAMKQEIYRNYPIGSKVELVERLLERGIAADGSPAPAPHDPQRAITQNRQPGKCCDTGCTVPGTPVMVDLPTVAAALPSRRSPA